MTLVHKPNSTDSSSEPLSLIQPNGIRSKTHPIGLAIQNGTLAPGLTAKNGTIYKQPGQVSGTDYFYYYIIILCNSYLFLVPI